MMFEYAAKVDSFTSGLFRSTQFSIQFLYVILFSFVCIYDGTRHKSKLLFISNYPLGVQFEGQLPDIG